MAGSGKAIGLHQPCPVALSVPGDRVAPLRRSHARCAGQARRGADAASSGSGHPHTREEKSTHCRSDRWPIGVRPRSQLTTVGPDRGRFTEQDIPRLEGVMIEEPIIAMRFLSQRHLTLLSAE